MIDDTEEKTPQQLWLEKELRWREIDKANREFLRKPIWLQAVLEGDRLADGSDEQEYDIKEEDNERN